MKNFLRAIVVLVLLGAAGAAALVYSGIYPIDATTPHPGPLYYVLHYTMKRAVAHHAQDIKVPELNDQRRVHDGFALYRQHCVQCHGAPGVAPDPFALGMMPEPPSLLPAARDWETRNIYWVVRHGVKMTSMPAWQYRFSDEQLWDVVAFIKALPQLSVQDYQALDSETPRPKPARPTWSAERTLGNPEAGKRVLHQYLCATCHSIPGVASTENNVGPPLAGIAKRQYIGGVLLNTPENMVRWLRSPPAVDPQSAMPDLHLTERDARDIAAYLYTLTGEK